MDKIKANMTKNRKGAGRPKIIVDIEILKNLASIGCPDYEIAKVLNVSARTLNRNYAEIIDQYREKGKASLRKKMWDKAIKKDSTDMQKWLSKQYLGMSDKLHQTTTTEPLPLIIEADAEDIDTDGKKKG
jgi:hypothetical protein